MKSNNRRDFLKVAGLGLGALAVNRKIKSGLDSITTLPNISSPSEFSQLANELELRPELKIASELFHNVDELSRVWNVDPAVAVGGLNSGFKDILTRVVEYTKTGNLNELVDLMQVPHHLPDNNQIVEIVNNVKLKIDPNNLIDGGQEDRIRSEITDLLQAYPTIALVLKHSMDEVKISSIVNDILIPLYHSTSGKWKYLFGNNGLLPGIFCNKNEDPQNGKVVGGGTKEGQSYLDDRCDYVNISLHEFSHGLENKSFTTGLDGNISSEIVSQFGLENYIKLINAKVTEVLKISKIIFDKNNNYLEKIIFDPRNKLYFDNWMTSFDVIGLSGEKPFKWEIGTSDAEYLRKTIDRFQLTQTIKLDFSSQIIGLNELIYQHLLLLNKDNLTDEEISIRDTNSADFSWKTIINPINEIEICLANNFPIRGEAMSNFHQFLLRKYKIAKQNVEYNFASPEDLSFIYQFETRQPTELFSMNERMLSHIFHHLTDVVDDRFLCFFEQTDNIKSYYGLSCIEDYISPYHIDEFAQIELTKMQAMLNGYRNQYEMFGATRRAILGLDPFGEYLPTKTDEDVFKLFERLNYDTKQYVYVTAENITNANDGYFFYELFYKTKEYLQSRFQSVHDSQALDTYINLQPTDVPINELTNDTLILVYDSKLGTSQIIQAKWKDPKDNILIYKNVETSDINSSNIPIRLFRNLSFKKLGTDSYYTMGDVCSFEFSDGGNSGYYRTSSRINDDKRSFQEIHCLKPDGNNTLIGLLCQNSFDNEPSILVLPSEEYQNMYSSVLINRNIDTQTTVLKIANFNVEIDYRGNAQKATVEFADRADNRQEIIVTVDGIRIGINNVY